MICHILVLSQKITFRPVLISLSTGRTFFCVPLGYPAGHPWTRVCLWFVDATDTPQPEPLHSLGLSTSVITFGTGQSGPAMRGIQGGQYPIRPGTGRGYFPSFNIWKPLNRQGWILGELFPPCNRGLVAYPLSTWERFEPESLGMAEAVALECVRAAWRAMGSPLSFTPYGSAWASSCALSSGAHRGHRNHGKPALSPLKNGGVMRPRQATGAGLAGDIDGTSRLKSA